MRTAYTTSVNECLADQVLNVPHLFFASSDLFTAEILLETFNGVFNEQVYVSVRLCQVNEKFMPLTSFFRRMEMCYQSKMLTSLEAGWTDRQTDLNGVGFLRIFKA